MNIEAIFSDETERYIFPQNITAGKRIHIRLRTHKDDELTPRVLVDGKSIPMYVEKEEGVFRYYDAVHLLMPGITRYCFSIDSDDGHWFFDKYGLSRDRRGEFDFRFCPDFDVPQWAKGAVMYQILVDRFANGDTTNDVMDGEYYYINGPVHRVEDWNRPPQPFDVNNFYGGDLEGVSQKLGYLKGLGVEVIYFNPLFVSPSNHKYDAQDYDHIDPHFTPIPKDGGACLSPGDNDNTHAERYIKRVTDIENLKTSDEFFANFVRIAHENDIKVILDGVFNHCGSFHKWMDKEGIYKGARGFLPGAYWDKNSPYNSYFSFGEDSWPGNNSYDGWWGHDTLPKLNFENSPDMMNAILEIGRKWVSPPYNADGWRLDVAADLGHSQEFNHYFWREFRKAVKSANPNAIILAEHYGDVTPWLSGDEWDTVMNYDAFMEPVSFLLTGMEKHSDRYEEWLLANAFAFEDTMKRNMARFMAPSLFSAMNQLSNHDHSRFLTRTNRKVGRIDTLGSDSAGEDLDLPIFREGVLLQMTWPGAPTLYYGDEAGVVGFTDPDSRRTYPWGAEDQSILDYYRDCISLHKMSRALKTGSMVFLYAMHGFISFGRFTQEEMVIVALNCGGEALEVNVPVWKAGVPLSCTMNRIMKTSPSGYSILPCEGEVKSGYLLVKLEPKGAEVYKYAVENPD